MGKNDRALENLAKFAERVRTVPRIQDALAKRMAKRMLRLVKKGFRGEHDPWGRRWKRKKRPDGRKVLHGPTGRLRKFKIVRADRRGVQLRAGAEYFKYLNPERPMLPGKTDLPKDWQRAFRTTAAKLFRRHFGR